ncbi:MAG: outer membrane protein assembly factor [Thermomonas sp.]|uniref:autotransporter assembly complex protein TamA n=1 Tax=Thermomonas sp. TaxID=1971895 RepID=UPI00260DD8B7|nr:autotransporter assembly complex family protein [Thermomonas sp.]MCC7096973.1 outer membrane protein assembly factor [Thermomonas sp.]
MPNTRYRITVALACLIASAPAFAVKVRQIRIEGLHDPAVEANVRSALSLQDALDRELRPRRLAYLLRTANDEVRTALEPFGYYAPTITIQRSDRSGITSTAHDEADEGSADDVASGDAKSDSPLLEDDDSAVDPPDPEAKGTIRSRGDALTVTITINLGPPVRVRGFDLGVDGAASTDPTVAAALAQFQPRAGEVMNHALYEDGKARISRALSAHGWFDASLDEHRVEVTREAQAADLQLRWNSGQRYTLGEARFNQTPTPFLRDDLLRKLVPWQVGEAYDDAELERLRRSLVALDYFALVDVQAQPDQASDHRTPVAVELTPAKRSIYTLGLSYGTLDGPGISASVERRYLNSRGHKALAQVDWARLRKAVTLQYRIPAFAWLDGWYTASLQASDEQTDYVNSRRLEFVASRSGQYNDHLNLIASLHLLRERWAYRSILKPTEDFRFASFLYPALQADYIAVDDRMAPRRGFGASAILRGGQGGSDGHASFAQLYLSAQWFHGFDADSRLIVRGEFGHTFTDDVLDLPPSLRFYAGGDRSVRGYGWHEIGPRIVTSGGDFFTGAPNLLTASLEYERYFNGPWGAAVFVDSGSAFDGRRPDMHTGVGIGLRWRSPVGPVRIDLAHGLNDPDSPVTLHLNIGADL